MKRSSLLKSPELLTVNLAVADIGMAVSMYPLAIASAWNHAWLGGDASCVYYALMGFLFGVCSMMTLCAMAVIRFLVTNSSKSNSKSLRLREPHNDAFGPLCSERDSAEHGLQYQISNCLNFNCNTKPPPFLAHLT